MTTSKTYVHGYNAREAERLGDQAGTLVELLHHDTSYPAGSTVLEVGCGTGAQTVTLARTSPQAKITSVDISEESLGLARQKIQALGLNNVKFLRGDIFALPFAAASFDHLFICFVLEHLPKPQLALAEMARMIKPGGTITVIEGDHGSTYFHPDSKAAHAAIRSLVEVQRRAGGDAMIGRQLYPLLIEAGLRDVQISPRMVYVDASKPKWVEGFTKKTFAAMVERVRERAIAENLIDPEVFDAGIAGLLRCAQADGVFCYTFFKGVGVVGQRE